MSRVLKFRAWSYTHKKMYDRVLAGPGDPCSIVWDEERKDWVNFDDACGAIMQFTGLLDKKGKEIFEGDICYLKDSYHETYEVYWNDDRWGLRHGDEDYDSGDYYRGDDINNWHEWEVLGNLYETPELLKEQA